MANTVVTIGSSWFRLDAVDGLVKSGDRWMLLLRGGQEIELP